MSHKLARMSEQASTVVEVMLYRRGAMIRRRARLASTGEGDELRPSLLRFDGLPANLDPDSLRVELTGGEHADAAGLPQLHGLRVVPSRQGNETPKAELEVARRELGLAQELERHYQSNLSSLSSLRTDIKAGGPRKRSFRIDNRLALIDLKARRARALDRKLAKARRELQRCEQRVELLEKNSASSGLEPSQSHKAVEIRLTWPDDTLAQDVVIELSYFTGSARWQPSYALHLNSTSEALELELRARVAQWTGEDWSQARLQLSTATYSSWTERPKLRSLRLGRAQRASLRPSGWRPLSLRRENLYVDFDREVEKFRDELTEKLERSSTVAAAAAWVGGPAASAEEDLAEAELPPESYEEELEMPPPTFGAATLTGSRRSMIGGFGSSKPSARSASSPAPASVRKARKKAPASDGPGRKMLDYGQLRIAGHGHRLRGQLIYVETTTVQVAVQDSSIEAFDQSWLQHWDERDAFDFVYQCDTPVDVASTQYGVVLSVTRRSAEASTRYLSVPSQSEQVFRRVELQNPLAGPLLPAAADVYRDGQFLLSTELPKTPVAGIVSLGLGVEPGIKIRRSLKYHEDSSGLLQRHNEIDVQLSIEVANRLQHATTLEVREALPTAATAHKDDVEVKLGEVNPPWQDYEPRDRRLKGGKRWTIELPAEGQRALKAGWSIRIPKKYEIAGGYRS